MAFLESVGSKVLAGTMVEIIKRTGMKLIENKQLFNLHQEIQSTISDVLSENESSGLNSYMELPSTINYIHNFIRLLPFQEYNAKGLKNFVTTTDFIHFLTQESIKHIVARQYNVPSQRVLENFFSNFIAVIERNLILEIPDELAVLPRIITTNIEQILRAYHESSAASSSLMTNYEVKRREYLNSAKHIFTKNHVPGIDILDFEEYYIYPKFNFFNNNNERNRHYPFDEDQETIEWKDIFLRSNLISIVGGPGYGKTLFLKNLVVNVHLLNINNPDKYLPIYCNLKEYVEKKRNFKGFSFKDFLVESIVEYTGANTSIEMIDYFLQRGECLIFLDALDEVESSEREKCSKIIISFYKNINSNNKLCITTRDRSLIPETPIVLKVTNIEKDDVIKYLKLMSNINEFREMDIDDFIKQIEPLINKMFVVNFLTVALMVKIYKADRKIPENKIDLFDKCVNYTAKERERDKKVAFDFEKMGSVINNDVTFENLASLSKPNNKEVRRNVITENLLDIFQDEYRDRNDASNAIEHFLNFCKDRTELYIQGMKEEHYKFFHRSFFEFFYAKYLVKNILGPVAIFNELHKFSADSELHELLIAYLKNYNYNRYQKLIDTVLDKFEKSQDPRTAQLALDMVHFSDQFSHKKKLYHLLFQKGKLETIGQMSYRFSNLHEILDSMLIFEDFIDNIVDKYASQFIRAIVRSYGDLNDSLIRFSSNDQIVSALWISIDIINPNNEKIKYFVDNLSYHEFITLAGTIEKIKIEENERTFVEINSKESHEIFNYIKEFKFSELYSPY